jgi:hypothetical protein
MKERRIHKQVSVMKYNQVAEGIQPGEGSLDLEAFPIPPHLPAIIPQGHPLIARGRNQLYPSLPQPVAQWVAVIGLVCNHSLGLLLRSAPPPPRNPDLFQGSFKQGHLRRAGRSHLGGHRKPLSICNHHPLRTLAPLGFPDSIAPFFAGAKLPSAKVSSHSNRPLASNSPRNSCMISSHNPSSAHHRILRQQVEGLGYLSGRSRQRAPVLRTQRIPSRQRRLSAQGRPPFFPLGNCGNKGSSFSHIRSVKSSCRAMDSSTTIMPQFNNYFNLLQRTKTGYETTCSKASHTISPILFVITFGVPR